MTSWLVVLLVGLPIPQSAAAVREPQALELSLSDTPGWSIDVAPSGHVTRSEFAPPGPMGPAWISPEARKRLRSLLTAQHFFSLQRQYGVCVVDGRERRISATLDGRRHDVILCNLRPGDSGSDARALLRVWYGGLAELAKDVRIEKDDARVLDERK